MLVPCLPLLECHSSTSAQPSCRDVITFVPAGFPFGPLTLQLPSQKSNWRNGLVEHALAGASLADAMKLIRDASISVSWRNRMAHSLSIRRTTVAPPSEVSVSLPAALMA